MELPLLYSFFAMPKVMDNSFVKMPWIDQYEAIDTSFFSIMLATKRELNLKDLIDRLRNIRKKILVCIESMFIENLNADNSNEFFENIKNIKEGNYGVADFFEKNKIPFPIKNISQKEVESIKKSVEARKEKERLAKGKSIQGLFALKLGAPEGAEIVEEYFFGRVKTSWEEYAPNSKESDATAYFHGMQTPSLYFLFQTLTEEIDKNKNQATILVLLEALQEFFPTKIKIEEIKKCLDKHYGKYEFTEEQDEKKIPYLDVIKITQTAFLEKFNDKLSNADLKDELSTLGEYLIDREVGNGSSLNFKYFEENGEELLWFDLLSQIKKINKKYPEDFDSLIESSPDFVNTIIRFIIDNIMGELKKQASS